MNKEMTCLDCGDVFYVPEEDVMTCYCEDCGSGHLKFQVFPQDYLSKQQSLLFPEEISQ